MVGYVDTAAWQMDRQIRAFFRWWRSGTSLATSLASAVSSLCVLDCASALNLVAENGALAQKSTWVSLTALLVEERQHGRRVFAFLVEYQDSSIGPSPIWPPFPSFAGYGHRQCTNRVFAPCAIRTLRQTTAVHAAKSRRDTAFLALVALGPQQVTGLLIM